jgi:hypothetical protein
MPMSRQSTRNRESRRLDLKPATSTSRTEAGELRNPGFYGVSFDLAFHILQQFTPTRPRFVHVSCTDSCTDSCTNSPLDSLWGRNGCLPGSARAPTRCRNRAMRPTVSLGGHTILISRPLLSRSIGSPWKCDASISRFFTSRRNFPGFLGEMPHNRAPNGPRMPGASALSMHLRWLPDQGCRTKDAYALVRPGV